MSDIEKTEHDTLIRTNDAEYVKLVSQISDLWDEARNTAFQAVNTSLLFANWHTGEYIVEYEQRGNIKAEYGKQLLTNLSKDLTLRLGKGYSRSNLFNMRLFYLTYPKIQTVSGQLSWSHYLELLKCDNELEREFYMTQARQEHWRVRELKRQMNSSLFERLALSSDKEGVLALAHQGTQVAKPSDIIHDPSEIHHQDIGQMNMYINYFKNEVCQPDDNPPIGVVLGAKKDELLMEYALAGIDNNLFAARYQLYLPNKAELQEQLNQLMDSNE